MKYLYMGVAALALAAAGAAAGPGNSQGKGKERAEQAADNRGGGPSMRAAGNERRGPSMQAANENRGQGRQPDRVEKRDNRGNANANPNRGVGNANRDNRNADRPAQALRNEAREIGRDLGRRDGRVRDDGLRIFETREARRWWGGDGRRGLIDGCPPGLAKKRNGCMPPGLAKRDDRRFRFADFRPDWWGLSGLGDGRYFYEDGYLLRYSGDRVTGYVPLLGGALAIGNPWPDYYDPRPVPDYYANYYGLGPAGSYRYADNVLYRVDPETAAITSIAALLTGDDIRVGQPMPVGYDVYNVPYPYRSQFADGPDSRYRYSDGYVYQIDPETRLVAAAIELLTS